MTAARYCQDAVMTFFVGTEIEMGEDTILVVEQVSDPEPLGDGTILNDD